MQESWFQGFQVLTLSILWEKRDNSCMCGAVFVCAKNEKSLQKVNTWLTTQCVSVWPRLGIFALMMPQVCLLFVDVNCYNATVL